MKFNVGDKVRIKNNNNTGYIEKVSRINNFGDVYYVCFFLSLAQEGKWFTENEIAKVEPVTEYRFEVRKNLITCKKYIDKQFVKKSFAKCHKDDEFDLNYGMSICMDRLNLSEIKIDDIVEITNFGETYPTNVYWLKKENIDFEYVAHFDYNNDKESASPNEQFIVIHKAPDEFDGILYLVQSTITKKTYIVNYKGIKKAN